MARQQLKQKERRGGAGDIVGQEVERTLTVDDCFLPSPVELEQYKAVDPKIVELLCEMSRREQENRHRQDAEKMKIIRSSERRQFRTNIWGMFFAFFALVVMMGVTALALYLDRPWLAGLFGTFSIVSVLSIFVSGKDKLK